jgi:hypothetical protein
MLLIAPLRMRRLSYPGGGQGDKRYESFFHTYAIVMTDLLSLLSVGL